MQLPFLPFNITFLFDCCTERKPNLIFLVLQLSEIKAPVSVTLVESRRGLPDSLLDVGKSSVVEAISRVSMLLKITYVARLLIRL